MSADRVEGSLPAAVYHEQDAISKSKADTFRRSRKRYYRRFVDKTLPPMEPTDQMKAGTVLHALVLEPHLFDKEFAVEEKGDGRTKAGKAYRKMFKEQNAGKTIVEPETMRLGSRMADEITQQTHAYELLTHEDAEVEQSLFWTDQQTGLECKARIDLVHPKCLVDVKTARDPSPEGFAKSCAALGYHRQAEWYQRGWKTLSGETLPFLFLVVGNEEPHDVAVYKLDEAAMQLAAGQNAVTLAQMELAIRNNEWASPWEVAINELQLPRYAAYQDEWEVYA
jgi:exodeoxyribonuclease VIII